MNELSQDHLTEPRTETRGAIVHVCKFAGGIKQSERPERVSRALHRLCVTPQFPDDGHKFPYNFILIFFLTVN